MFFLSEGYEFYSMACMVMGQRVPVNQLPGRRDWRLAFAFAFTLFFVLVSTYLH